MPDAFTTNWWPFPPETHEIQFDEKWAFVYRKERRAKRGQDSEGQRTPQGRWGENWDHVALDPEQRLVLEVVCGKRTKQNVRKLVRGARRRTSNGIMRLITSDEYKPYRPEILDAYGQEVPRRYPDMPGRRRKLQKVPPPELLYATVHKTRRKGRVVKVETRIQFGTQERLEAALAASSVSKAVNTSFIERHNGTDRHRNSRKVRRTYRFSKDWEVHEAVTYLTMYSYNFCWPVRTLRQKIGPRRYRQRTPAMAAELTDHVWTLEEWATFPARWYKAI